MEIEQSASINEKSDKEIVKENEEIKEKKRKRNQEYQRAWRQRQKSLKKKVSNEEKEEKRRKRHRENQRAYYHRIKSLKENDKNVEELSQKKLDDLQMKRKKLDSNEDQDNVVQCRASQNLENVQLEQNQFLTQQLRIVTGQDTGNPSDDDSQEQLLVPQTSIHTESDTDKDFIKIEIQDEDIYNDADQEDTELISADATPAPAFQYQIQNSNVIESDNRHSNREVVNEVPDERHEFDVFGDCVAAQLKNMPFRAALEAQMNIQHYLSNLRLQLTQRNPCSCSTHRINTI